MKRKLIYRSVAYLYFVSFIIVALLFALLRIIDLHNLYYYDIVLFVSFIAIGIISAYSLTVSALNAGISLAVIHWYFVLIFFFVVPFVQYLGGLYKYPLDSHNILIGNGYILLWCMVYWFFYQSAIKSAKVPLRIMSLLSVKLTKDVRIKMYVLTLMAILATLYLVSLAGIEAFYTRLLRLKLIAQLGGWGPLALLVTYYVRPVVFCILLIFCALLIWKHLKGTAILYLSLFLLLIVNLIMNNPISVAKFYAFTLLFGISVLLWHHFPRPTLTYIIILSIGLPLSAIVDQFRRIASFSEFKLQFNWSFMFAGQFDAYENFIHTINYVSEYGTTYGRQLLGALLFFVPRSVWTNKPIGSGAFIAESMRSRFIVENVNVANPLPSEMFLNFHVIGIVFGGIVYGSLTGWLDKYYWLSIERSRFKQSTGGQEINFYLLLYPFLLGLFLFHLRGDFMSSFAYASGFILAFLSVVGVIRLNLQKT